MTAAGKRRKVIGMPVADTAWIDRLPDEMAGQRTLLRGLLHAATPAIRVSGDALAGFAGSESSP
jgi:hypothetical protein